MNDESPGPSTGTAVALVPDNLPAILADPKRVDDMLGRIALAAKLKAMDADVATAKGRDTIRSAAHWVARSKTAMLDAALALTEEHRAKIKAVNAERNRIEEALDATKAEVRAPLTKWEEDEKARIAAHRAGLAMFDLEPLRLHAGLGAEDIKAFIDAFESVVIDDSWEEFTAEAGVAKDAALRVLRPMHEEAVKRDQERAELARLRAEDEARKAAEAEAERARATALAAERAEQAERDRLARIEQEKAEAAEAARVEAERAASAKIAEAEAATQRAQEAAAAAARKAEADKAAAVEAERQRAADQRKAEAAAQAKRDANTRLRNKAKLAIAAALTGLVPKGGQTREECIAAALMEGKIPHVEVRL